MSQEFSFNPANLLQTELKKIDIEIDRNATFIAYCIWHYKKTLAQLVIPVRFFFVFDVIFLNSLSLEKLILHS